MKKWLKWVIIIVIVLIFLLITYTILSILIVGESLDPTDCEKITGPLATSRTVECYLDIGIKLADPNICEKITEEQPAYARGKLYCKAVASRNVTNCDSLVDFWKDRCKAILLKDSSFCDMKEGKPSQGCLNTIENYESYIK